MHPRRLPLGVVIPVALAVLVAALAVLQYRWLGQVSAAERERMKTTLMQRADAFARDFDREVLHLYLALQTESAGLALRDWTAFSRRYDIWRQSAEYPQIVKAIYFVEREEAATPLLQYKPDARTFEVVDWPDDLAVVRERIRQPDGRIDSSPGAQARTFLLRREPIIPSIPALVLSLPVVQPLSGNDSRSKVSFQLSSRFLIAVLDRSYLESTLLPALAARHFPEQDAADYRFGVLDNGAQAAAIYSHGVASGATLDPGKADAVVPFFSLRLDLTNQVTARAMLLHGAASGFDIMAAPPPPPPAPVAGWVERATVTTADGSRPRVVAPAPMPPPRSGSTSSATATRSNASPRVANSVAPLGRGPSAARESSTTVPYGVAATAPGPPRPPVRNDAGGRAGTVSIFVEQRGVNDFRVSQGIGSPAWQFVVQHTAGSLDAAVAQLRRRNLYLSFGILAVLASGIGLVVLNARRSERLAAQQMDFVATVSHELRTPLAVIRSAAQNLAAGVVHEPAQARRYGDLIEQEGRRLTDMVEQVLAYAGVSDSRGLVSARPADAGAIVGDVLAASAPLVEAAGFEQDLDIAGDLPPVMADVGAIRRAVHNLVTNALKHGADGRWLGVAVGRAVPTTPLKGQSEEVLIAVSDRGRGIDAPDLPHIFEPFYRGRFALDRQIQGNGLGLSLVKRVAEAHGGRISVRSAAGQGTTFTLHLPAMSGVHLQLDDAEVTEDVPAAAKPRRAIEPKPAEESS
jgi:signal transduction histidine kinase